MITKTPLIARLDENKVRLAKTSINLYHADETRGSTRGPTVSRYDDVTDSEILAPNLLQFVHKRSDGILELILTNLPFKLYTELVELPTDNPNLN